MKTVNEMLVAKARAMGHRRYFGKVVVCLHIDRDGRVSNRDLCRKSGDPAGDRFALAVVDAFDTLPPPPSAGGVVWVYAFEDEPSPR